MQTLIETIKQLTNERKNHVASSEAGESDFNRFLLSLAGSARTNLIAMSREQVNHGIATDLPGELTIDVYNDWHASLLAEDAVSEFMMDAGLGKNISWHEGMFNQWASLASITGTTESDVLSSIDYMIGQYSPLTEGARAVIAKIGGEDARRQLGKAVTDATNNAILIGARDEIATFVMDAVNSIELEECDLDTSRPQIVKALLKAQSAHNRYCLARATQSDDKFTTAVLLTSIDQVTTMFDTHGVTA